MVSSFQEKLTDILSEIEVNLDYSNNSIGTAMEVEHAHCNNIPVIAFGSQESTWYNWVKERATIVFEDLDEACFYINETYVDSILHL